MTQSPNEAKSVRDVLEKLKKYYAVSVDKSEILNADEAVTAIRSLIEKEVIDTKRDLYITHSNKDFVDGYSAGRDDLRTEQRAKLKEVMEEV